MKARLLTGNKKKKTFLKPLSVVKVVCREFGILVNKVIRFTATFKYATASVPLSAAAPKSPLY